MNWNRTGVSLTALVLSVVAFGQTTTSPTTCTTPPTSLTALNLERAVPLVNILSTLPPNAPANVLAAIAGGALEIRQILIYNPQLGTITATVFLVPAGSPLPTPNFDFTTGVVQSTTVQISQILTSCKPSPSILVVGTVTSSLSNAFGSQTGASAALALGYTTDSPPKLNNVVLVIAGLSTSWSASASGTLAFPPPPPGPSTAGTGPTIVVKFANGTTAIANTTTQVASSPLLLDASGSTGSGALTYAWTTMSNAPVAFVGTGTPGQVLVQFPGPGDYAILLTVTDSTGAKATFPLTLEYIGRPQ
jgi:hypothetical protein